MKSYFYFQFQVLSVSVVRLSYEYSNMTLKSPAYCDRTWCVVIFFLQIQREIHIESWLENLIRKTNSKS